jgi:hypothetical protein
MAAIGEIGVVRGVDRPGDDPAIDEDGLAEHDVRLSGVRPVRLLRRLLRQYWGVDGSRCLLRPGHPRGSVFRPSWVRLCGAPRRSLARRSRDPGQPSEVTVCCSKVPYAGAMNLVFAPFVSLDDRQLSKDLDGVA